MAMLDMINRTSGKKPTWVLLCQIINRFPGGGHEATAGFNDAVQYHAENSSGDQFNIIVVDMENGAGFNYSDEPVPVPDSENLDRAVPPFDCSGYTSCGDMWGKKYNSVRDPGSGGDPYHPNDLGNRRMAWKFEEVLISTALRW
jgi:hypothetical protein